MSSNPLFPNNPLRPEPADDAAVQLIRQKVARAFGEEPAALEELAEATRERTLSKHQLFMLELSQAGKSLAEIQTAWHHYYTQLPDTEKREVWEEFYAANQHTPYQKLFQKQTPISSRIRPQTTAIREHSTTQVASISESGVTVADYSRDQNNDQLVAAKPSKLHTVLGKSKTGRQILEKSNSLPATRLRKRIRDKVSANGQLQVKHHFQSLLFGLGMGFLVVAVLLFGFFNEYVIAPFIQPSRNVSATPVIVSDAAAATAQPTVIVPKINIQIPVDFTLQTNDEATVDSALNNGIVHYFSTALPGQNGNGAYFGHSSRNIFNNGKYKFAFVLLRELTTGDIFYVTYQGKVYAYQVFAREIVPPTQISVLDDTKGKQATAVLITCDPPGFSTNRLVVWGEQISPSPATNTVASAPEVAPPAEITSNGPTLWTRMIRAIEFWR
jgi:LPXTG-site transpeptidase (sortase) family protein